MLNWLKSPADPEILRLRSKSSEIDNQLIVNQ
jgi:hypothetical protein